MRLRHAAFIVALVVFGYSIARADTILHPGDKIDVTVFNHPELSGTRTIDASGNVSIPVAGSVAASNVDSDALADVIRERLMPYVRDVAVQVKLDTQTASIFVAGGPRGVIPYIPGMTIASAIASLDQVPATPAPNAAPSGTDLVNGPIDFRHVSIVRNGTKLESVDVIRLRETGQTGPELQPNDTIQLVDKPVAVQVTGDVARPGIAYLESNEPLSQALTQVGGLAASARIDQLQLVRGGESQYVALGSPVFSQAARSGDELIVPRATHVDVLGTVVKPGDTMLRGSNTLVSAIYYAGGPAQFANLRAVQVIRDGHKRQYDLGKVEKGGSGDNPELADGDIVFVPKGSTFQWSDVWGALGSLGLFGVHI